MKRLGTALDSDPRKLRKGLAEAWAWSTRPIAEVGSKRVDRDVVHRALGIGGVGFARDVDVLREANGELMCRHGDITMPVQRSVERNRSTSNVPDATIPTTA